MTATGYTESTGDVSHDFAISIYGEGGGTGIGEWLNGYDSQAAWGVYYDNTDNYFYLTYEYSNLNFSPVPEPSTYFMTGTLLCFIACNRQSRKSIQLFFAKVWGNPSSNGNCSKIKNRVL